jgi:formylglycine-generating enzyme required for sulfatase activity
MTAQADRRALSPCRKWKRFGMVAVVVIVAMLCGTLLPGRRRGAGANEQRQAWASPPTDMVLVPAGPFTMGSDDEDADPDERPRREVYVPAFYIDRYEVTNGAYHAVYPEHMYPPGTDRVPITGVTREQAMMYCRAVGKRLPTGAEWEKAARGTDGRRYPWGDAWDPARANVEPRISVPSARDTGTPDPAPACAGLPAGKMPVGSFPEGVSPYGLHDMAGNVWEWVADSYQPKTSPGDTKEVPARGVLRGGAYGYGALQARTSYQGFEDPDTACHDSGFRCAMDARPVQHH